MRDQVELYESSGGTQGTTLSVLVAREEDERLPDLPVVILTTLGAKAALVAEGLDLFEEVLDGDGGVLGSAFAQVLAVGVDEAGAVFGDAEHPLGPVGSCVAFDGVQGQLQTAGAFEQAHALIEQVMDLVPAFQGGSGAGSIRSDGCSGPRQRCPARLTT
ncbi:hypothetical protein [Streptomyces sp. NPDC058335]|uniref:hypothetical protein n=1 Tax=Streptomyces sp. NPDC058335 TaxID=3346451 RepID=UPI00364BA8B3